jgi:hypothetical protein
LPFLGAEVAKRRPPPNIKIISQLKRDVLPQRGAKNPYPTIFLHFPITLLFPSDYPISRAGIILPPIVIQIAAFFEFFTISLFCSFAANFSGAAKWPPNYFANFVSNL